MKSMVRPELAAQVVEQVEDGRLHRHVERRHRLVGDQQLRLERERAGDRHALALAAREVARVRSRAPGPGGRPGRAAPGSGRRCRSAATILWTRRSSESVWRTVIRGFSDEYGSWNTIWIRRRSDRCALQRRAARRRSGSRRPSARAGRRCSGRASTCRSPTRRRARAPRRGMISRSTPSTARSTSAGHAPRAARDRVGDREVHVDALDLEQRVRHPATTGRRATSATHASEWMQAVARPAESGRSGNSPEMQSSWANGQRGMEPAARRRQHEVGRRSLDRRERVLHAVEVGHRAQQAERVRVPRRPEHLVDRARSRRSARRT